jgi:hypothetical protein
MSNSSPLKLRIVNGHSRLLRRLMVQGLPKEKQFLRPHLNEGKSWAQWHAPVIPAMMRSIK